MTTAGSLLMIPWLLVAPAPGEPLDADVFDASTYPEILIDVTPPTRYSAVVITPDMIELAAGSIESVTPVDPSSIVVGLVIDDSPAVTAEDLNKAQGAAVELVRNVGDGTSIALGSPSGLQSALTADRDANIARIAGIVAGAPDVVPLPALIADAATRLAESPKSDRHLVVVQATELTDPAALQALTEIVDAAGIVVHVVAAPGLATGPLAEIAVASGGVVPVSPDMVGEMDQVTAAVSDRSRIAATVAGEGPQELALTVGGERFATEIAIAAPTAPVATTVAPGVTAAAPAAPAVPAVPAVPAPDVPATAVAAPAPPSTVAASPTTAAEDAGASGGNAGMLVGAALAVLVVGLSCLWIVLRRRSSGTDVASDSEPVPSRPLTDDPPSPAPVIVPPEPSWAVTVEPVTARNVQTEPAPEPKVGPEPVIQVEPEPVAESVPEPEPVVAVEPEPIVESVPEPEPVVEVEPEPVAESGPEPEPVAGNDLADAGPVAPATTRPARGARAPARASASTRRSAPRRRGSPSPPPARPSRSARTSNPPAKPTDGAGWLVIGDLRMNSATGEVWAGSREVRLTPAELAVLELLMISGGQGVTREAMIKAAQLGEDSDDSEDPDAILAQLRRKTRIGGAGQSVRKERVALYFFGDEHDDDQR